MRAFTLLVASMVEVSTLRHKQMCRPKQTGTAGLKTSVAFFISIIIIISLTSSSQVVTNSPGV
jgi:hypothetical protein